MLFAKRSIIWSVAYAIPAYIIASGEEPKRSTMLLKRWGINEPLSFMALAT